MDKIFNNYNWDAFFDDLQDDIDTLVYNVDEPKRVKSVMHDMKCIRDSVRNADIKKSKHVRYFAKVITSYIKSAKRDVNKHDSDDLQNQSDYLGNYIDNGWKQQIKYNCK